MRLARLAALACPLLLSCATGPASTARVEPAPVTPPPRVTPVPPRAVAPAGLPLLGPELFAPDGAHPQLLFTVGGVLVVVDETRRVGSVKGDAITWLDRALPPAHDHWGGWSEIQAMGGSWPDRVDVLYVTTITRTAYSYYLPLTGHGRAINSAPSNGMHGLAVLGDTTVVSTDEASASIQTVRGPVVVRKPTPWAKLCKGTKSGEGAPSNRALRPFAFAGSPAETLVAVGLLCQRRDAPAAEFWDKSGASRVLELAGWAEGDVYGARVLPGSGDELFLIPYAEGPILAVRAGAIAPVPPLERRQRNAFVSANGKLHVSDGRTIRRLDEGGWTTVARLAWPEQFDAMAIDEDTLWASRQSFIFRLRPAADVAHRKGCATPFVYLYDASPNNGDRFTYPQTRKALSSFGTSPA